MVNQFWIKFFIYNSTYIMDRNMFDEQFISLKMHWIIEVCALLQTITIKIFQQNEYFKGIGNSCIWRPLYCCCLPKRGAVWKGEFVLFQFLNFPFFVFRIQVLSDFSIMETLHLKQLDRQCFWSSRKLMTIFFCPATTLIRDPWSLIQASHVL